MRNPDEAIALQAVEFWSTVCDEEIELAIDAAEVSGGPRPFFPNPVLTSFVSPPGC